MTDTYKATPEQWQHITDFRLLELQARIEQLEAQASSREVADPAPVAGGLVEQVSDAITSETGSRWASTEARAAILEVATWLREQGTPASGWAMRLEQEAGQ